MSLFLAFCVVAFFSFMAFWRWSAVIFMLAGGASLILGFYWYDYYTNSLGLSISLMLIMYAIVCIALAFRCMFWQGVKEEDKE